MPYWREPTPGELDTKPNVVEGNYPRLLNLADNVSEALKQYLDQEIMNHEAERSTWVGDLIDWQHGYWATPVPSAEANAKGYAQIVIPLTAIAVEAVHARHMTTLFGKKQLVAAKIVDPRFADAGQPFEAFLENQLRYSAKIQDNLESTILEIAKLGTGVARAEWKEYVKYGIAEIGGKEVEIPVYTERGPGIFSVPLSRFVMPFNELDAQKARWCGEIQEFTQTSLYNAEVQGLFAPGTYDTISTYLSNVSQDDQYETSQQALEQMTPAFPDTLDIYCMWLAYDTMDIGRPYEIQVYYHWQSRTLCAVRYNWNRDLRRPYRHRPYFKIENRWTGIGIGKMNEQFQAEITTQHRQRLDNATLANMRMMKISRVSGYGPNEPVFPGKIWYLNDMAHVEPMQMGEIYPSSYNNENSTLLYSQQRTGVNEVSLGMPSIGTPGTATGDLARVQEGRRRFDYSYNNIKSLVNDLLYDTVRVIHQYGASRMDYFSKVSGGQQVFELFANNTADDLTSGIVLEIVTAGEQDNDIVLRQNWTQIAGMLVNYYTSIIQLAQGMGDPQLLQMVTKKAMISATEAMKQILLSYDIPNSERMVLGELLSGNLGQLSNGQGGPAGTNPLELLQSMANSNGSGQGLLPAQLGQPQPV